jgi:hypothetical protein
LRPRQPTCTWAAGAAISSRSRRASRGDAGDLPLRQHDRPEHQRLGRFQPFGAGDLLHVAGHHEQADRLRPAAPGELLAEMQQAVETMVAPGRDRGVVDRVLGRDGDAQPVHNVGRRVGGQRLEQLAHIARVGRSQRVLVRPGVAERVARPRDRHGDPFVPQLRDELGEHRMSTVEDEDVRRGGGVRSLIEWGLPPERLERAVLRGEGPLAVVMFATGPRAHRVGFGPVPLPLERVRRQRHPVAPTGPGWPVDSHAMAPQ